MLERKKKQWRSRSFPRRLHPSHRVRGGERIREKWRSRSLPRRPSRACQIYGGERESDGYGKKNLTDHHLHILSLRFMFLHFWTILSSERDRGLLSSHSWRCFYLLSSSPCLWALLGALSALRPFGRFVFFFTFTLCRSFSLWEDVSSCCGSFAAGAVGEILLRWVLFLSFLSHKIDLSTWCPNGGFKK